MAKEYTNKQILITLREELLRRKELLDKVKDCFEYDNSKTIIKSKDWYFYKGKMYLDFSFGGITPLSYMLQYINFIYSDNEYIVRSNLKNIKLEKLIRNEDEVKNILFALSKELRNPISFDSNIWIKNSASEFRLNNSGYNIIYTPIEDNFIVEKTKGKNGISNKELEDLFNIKRDSAFFSKDLESMFKNNESKNIILPEEIKKDKKVYRKIYSVEDKEEYIKLI